LMLWFGTEVIRNNDPDHWIKCLHTKIISYMADMGENDTYKTIATIKSEGEKTIDEVVYAPIGIVITDVRFPNEFEYLKNIGATIIKVTRDINTSTDIADVAL